MMVDAIFLDRDGTINVERPDYVKTWSEFAFLPGAPAALAALARLGCPLIVITNQSAIGRGHVSRAAVDEIHGRMVAEIVAAGGRIDALYLCPHHPDEGCGCRKPAPGLLVRAAADLGVALDRCVFVGDSLGDEEAARRAGCLSLLVASGRQGALLRERAAQGGDAAQGGNAAQGGQRAQGGSASEAPLFETLAEAAAWLVTRIEQAAHESSATESSVHEAADRPLEWVVKSNG